MLCWQLFIFRFHMIANCAIEFIAAEWKIEIKAETKWKGELENIGMEWNLPDENVPDFFLLLFPFFCLAFYFDIRKYIHIM